MKMLEVSFPKYLWLNFGKFGMSDNGTDTVSLKSFPKIPMCARGAFVMIKSRSDDVAGFMFGRAGPSMS